MNAVETIGLRKAYGPKTVLAGVDLTVARGSVFALLGPNGAGKTTTVRILATLQPPDGGRARVCGRDVVGEPAAVRRAISLTGQFAAVDEQLTAEENLLLMGRLRHLGRAERRRRAAELLDLLELTADARSRVRSLSGGMRRKVDLAMSLIARPEVLFLDEPTTGLDPRSRQAVWDVVGELAADGVTIFLTTQYLEEADRLAGLIAVLDGGRVVAAGSADELKRRVGTEQVSLLLAGPAGPALALLGDTVVRTAEETVWVATDGTAGHLRHVLNTLAEGGIPVRTVTAHRPTLDDVFRTLTDRTESRTLEGATR
ncbi:MAG TPA: ATP-binding cassette domain-containing protein [Mycobacteriales bacterium]|nr:ATP-binding cassette domain-containing protein [Mycobacteriales bacterium]